MHHLFSPTRRRSSMVVLLCLAGSLVSVGTGAADSPLSLEDLQTLQAQLVDSGPSSLAFTLPVYARYLQGGTIAIRGRLEGTRVEGGDTVFAFRILEVFAWRQRAPLEQCPADSVLVFRANTRHVRSLLERRSHGRYDDLVEGGQYWVTTTSLEMHPHGGLLFSGFFPIRDDAIIVDYAELERSEPAGPLSSPSGPLTTHSASLRLPLPMYRECLAGSPSTEASRLLTAMWSCR